MTTKSLLAAFLSTLVFASACPTASATLLIFSDNFNTANSTDLNQNLATRQSGTLATRTWTKAGGGSNVSISSNQLSLAPNAGLNFTTILGEDANFRNAIQNPTYPGFSIGFDMTYTGSVAGAWTSPYLRTQGSGDERALSRFGILAFENGTVQAHFDNAGSRGTAALTPAQLTALLGTWNVKQQNSYLLDATKLTANSGTYNVFINDVLVFQNLSYTFNNINLRWDIINPANGGAVYDNLQIFLTPEPSTTLLSGLGVMLVLLRRRRTR